MAATSKQLTRDLETREKRLLELRAEQDETAAKLGKVSALRGQAADAELEGDLDAPARLRAKASRIEEGARAREGELAALVPRLQSLIEQLKQDLERAHFDEALARRDAKAREAVKLTRGIASALRGPLSDTLKLSELRAEFDVLDAQARELAKPLGAKVDPSEDEPSFGDQSALDLLQAGPRQPNATAKAEAERDAARHAINRPAVIERAVREQLSSMIPMVVNGHARLSPIERLPEGQRADALEAYAKAVKRLPDHVRGTQERRLAVLIERLEVTPSPLVAA